MLVVRISKSLVGLLYDSLDESMGSLRKGPLIADRFAVNRLTKFESMASEQCASCIGTRLTRNSLMGEFR